ncbi:tetratricopeptide repeat protein [Candidatus Saccharibacteria bacterium]|nr:tetratricopeptide repeat protein [Candidatus Saccharibacteria bacterium]
MMGFIGVLLLAGLGIFVVLYTPSVAELKENKPPRLAEQLDKLWVMSRDSIKSKHYLRAEKILLTMLQVDNKNAAAYNRLGLLYAKEKEFRDAIECFEIAQSLDPSASNLHNVGMLYFEMGDYERASQALAQALESEDDVATRHIAYAKVQEKLGEKNKVITHLEKAALLAPSKQIIEVLISTYREYEMDDKADALEKKLKTSKIKTVRQTQKHRSSI